LQQADWRSESKASCKFHHFRDVQARGVARPVTGLATGVFDCVAA